MKRTIVRSLAVLVVGIALGASVAYTAERHPAIHSAEKDLRHAKDTLEHADHDFGGHRVKAIEHVNAALDELHLALDFDKK